MATWKYTDIIVNGHHVKAQAPLIVSASRSTDIPAFYADWFFKRLEIGYSVWKNPFNGIKSYISYDDVHFIVFWSKNPRPLLNYLDILEGKNIKCYIQFTLNDYEEEGFEKVPKLENRIETFKLLVERLGKGSVVWRFDPMILTDHVSIDRLLTKVRNIGDQLMGYTEKLVFSYADIAQYKKVRANLESNGISYHEWTKKQMEFFAQGLSVMNKERGWNYTLATCCENIDVLKYGIVHNRCIDGDLITRIAWMDKELMDFMKVSIQDIPSPSLFGDVDIPEGAILLPNNKFFIGSHKKDPGQRIFCSCMVSKDVGEYNTCPHFCDYCYANTCKEAVLTNWTHYLNNPNSETITGK